LFRKPNTLTPDERASYAAFCDAAPDLPFYFLPHYLDGIVGLELWSAALVQENGVVQAIWPYCLKQRFGMWFVVMPPLTKYAGPYLSPQNRTHSRALELTQKLLVQLPDLLKWEQMCSPVYIEALAFHWYAPQFRYQPLFTYRLVQSDHWQASISKKRRQQLRKSEATLLEHDDVQKDDIHRLLQLTYSRQNQKSPFSYDTIKHHLDVLEQCGHAKYFGAADQSGRLVSVACLAFDKSTAYYHIAADDPTYRHLNAGAWLIRRAIEYSFHTLGVQIFDFEGSMIESIATVRRSFGAVPHTYYKLSYNKLKP
jgi:hypothetical protein